LFEFLVVSAGFTIAQAAEDPDLVYLHVSAIDRERGRPVRGIAEENFKILEGDKLQKIVSLSQEEVPLAVGILIDAHGEMKPTIKKGVDALTRSLGRQDQIFVAEAGDNRLNDAVLQNLQKVLQLTNKRRALVLVTDRTDPSGYVFTKVKELLRMEDIQLYSIAILKSEGPLPNSSADIFRDLAELSGGNTYVPFSAVEVSDITKKIAAELKNQYVIGYRPANQANDGKWRKIKITAQFIDDKQKIQKPIVRAKSGYYPPLGTAASAKN